MCGFVGWVGQTPATEGDLTVLKKMNRALAHRGPDDEGYYLQGKIALAHRRLSILDLSSAGRQPMSNPSGTVFTIYNGEIYNFQSLRQELEGLGHTFRTNTDTEVMIASYEQWGLGFLSRLEGMYSLAIWDVKRNKIVLIKDRFGKKPLYYGICGDRLVFGSEIKAFMAHGEFQANLNLTALSQYLAHDYVPTPLTIYQNVLKLPAGAYLEIDVADPLRLPSPKVYWSPNYEPKLTLSLDDCQDLVWELLQQAVTKRLVSDVPIGLFLSGGLDSSAIASVMAGLGPAEFKTFNIGFNEGSYNESSYARIVANHLGSTHCEETLDEVVMLDILPSIVEKLDEPFADPSIVPSFLLCRFARQQVTVALSGDGGDEIFAGYDPFVAHKLTTSNGLINGGLGRLMWLCGRLIPASERNMSLNFKLKHFSKGLLHPDLNTPGLRNLAWMSSFLPRAQSELLTGVTFEQCKDMAFQAMRRTDRETDCGTLTDQVIDNYIKYYLHDDILVKMDRASMMNSLEVRSPLLDSRLVETVNRLPVTMKMKLFTRKYLLKRTMRSKLPAGIVDRPKKGFGVPLGKWLKHDLRELALDYLSPGLIKRQGLFNPDEVWRLLDNHLNNRCDNRKELWNLLVFQMWRMQQSG